MENYFIDTHSHIDMIEDIELKDILQNANNAGVKKIIIPATINTIPHIILSIFFIYFTSLLFVFF